MLSLGCLMYLAALPIILNTVPLEKTDMPAHQACFVTLIRGQGQTGQTPWEPAVRTPWALSELVFGAIPLGVTNKPFSPNAAGHYDKFLIHDSLTCSQPTV